MRNIRLAERVAELAAEGERGRIAREIHDGIAQMVFMLSLSLETAIDRVGGDPEEQRRRLQDLTALAKNALWEVRQYIFDLRPLLAGDEGLVGAVQGQVKEFQAVSDLPVELARHRRAAAAADGDERRALPHRAGGAGQHLPPRARVARRDRAGVRRATRVALSISDDGVGMSEGEPGGARRLRHGQPARSASTTCGGTLDVQQRAGRGHAHRAFRCR